MTKASLRQTIREQFLCSTAAEREQWARTLCAALLADQHIHAARYILAFYPLPDEIDITPIFSPLTTAGKTLLLPEVTSAEDMILREYNEGDGLTEGTFHTLISTGAVFTNYTLIDVALVPGVAFTKAGARLGRGKGYYDRFLPRLTHAYLRGVCFPYQIVESIPCAPHDILMDYV